MDSLRYWVTEMHVDGFRFDLAATLARAVPRGRPAVGVLRPGPAGPGRQPGQADRRAVGRRRRRLPGRQLPAAVDRVERQVPRHRPRLLARRAVDARRVRLAAHRLVATSTSTTAARPFASASTSSPPTTASRCATWSPTTRSTTRPTARTTTTARATTGRGTAASRATTDDPDDPGAARPAAAQLPGHAAALARACRCSLHGDELGRTQRGNNNVYCQDNEISWVDWELDAGRSRAAGLHPAADRSCAASTRCSAAAGSSPGDAEHGGESELGDIAWFQPDGSQMDDDDWQDGDAQHARWSSSTAARSPSRTRAASRRRRLVPVLFNASPDDVEFVLPERGVRRALADRGRQRGADGRRRLGPVRLRCRGRREVALGAGPARPAVGQPGERAAPTRRRPARAGRHLPAAAPRRLRLRRRRRASCRTCAASASRTPTSRRSCTADPGLDPRVRRRRPLLDLGRARRPRRARAAWSTALHARRPGRRRRRRAQPHGRADAGLAQRRAVVGPARRPGLAVRRVVRRRLARRPRRAPDAGAGRAGSGRCSRPAS